jgi:hypothetical protein
MKRYYDSEIFHQMLDGIDLDDHVIASYYLKDRLEGEKFLDHFALVQSMALEGSTGTWEKVEEDTEEVRKAMSSKMVGYHEIPGEDRYTKSAVVQLAFPSRSWGYNVPMMLLAPAGGRGTGQTNAGGNVRRDLHAQQPGHAAGDFIQRGHPARPVRSPGRWRDRASGPSAHPLFEAPRGT